MNPAVSPQVLEQYMVPGIFAIGIGVLLELHAANGSQNGYDHSAPVKSGARCWCIWYRGFKYLR